MATRRYRRIEIGEYVIPDDAFSLIQDIQILEQMLDLLEKVRDRSITTYKGEFSTDARQMLRRVAFLIAGMHSIAVDNLRFDFLGGRRIRPRQSRQTLADVWQAVLDGKESLNVVAPEVSKNTQP